MRVVFRTDASSQIGIGHVMRCLTLADKLRDRGSEVIFICAEMQGDMNKPILEKGFPVFPVTLGTNSGLDNYDWKTDAAMTNDTLIDLNGVDWLIVDHYALGLEWETAIRPYIKHIMVIDDLADRKHDCDLLLDQNYYRDQENRYQDLLPDHCVTLLGPANVLLRSEFTNAMKKLRKRDGSVQRILVFFGGGDLTNQTRNVVKALKLLDNHEINMDIVVGMANPSRNVIQALCEGMLNVSFHCQVTNMAELIHNADLGIGAGGSAMWERCCLGLPTITVVTAENQEKTTVDVDSVGAIEYLGWYNELGSEDYARAITRMIENPLRLIQIGEAAFSILQARGVCLEDIMHDITEKTQDLHSLNHPVAR